MASSPKPKTMRKRFAVVTPGTAKPIAEHTCLSDSLDHARDAIKQGARSVTILKLKRA
jgi:hypothetical protein